MRNCDKYIINRSRANCVYDVLQKRHAIQLEKGFCPTHAPGLSSGKYDCSIHGMARRNAVPRLISFAFATNGKGTTPGSDSPPYR